MSLAIRRAISDAAKHQASIADDGREFTQEELRRAAKRAILFGLSSNANVHRAILLHTRDRFLADATREVGLFLSPSDLGDIFDALERNRPPWLHELADGTILDENGFPLAHPDADDLEGARQVLKAAKAADEVIDQIRAEQARNAPRS